jgi:hypothetical protein
MRRDHPAGSHGGLEHKSMEQIQQCVLEHCVLPKPDMKLREGKQRKHHKQTSVTPKMRNPIPPGLRSEDAAMSICWKTVGHSFSHEISIMSNASAQTY